MRYPQERIIAAGAVCIDRSVPHEAASSSDGDARKDAEAIKVQVVDYLVHEGLYQVERIDSTTVSRDGTAKLASPWLLRRPASLKEVVDQKRRESILRQPRRREWYDPKLQLFSPDNYYTYTYSAERSERRSAGAQDSEPGSLHSSAPSRALEARRRRHERSRYSNKRSSQSNATNRTLLLEDNIHDIRRARHTAAGPSDDATTDTSCHQRSWNGDSIRREGCGSERSCISSPAVLVLGTDRQRRSQRKSAASTTQPRRRTSEGTQSTTSLDEFFRGQERLTMERQLSKEKQNKVVDAEVALKVPLVVLNRQESSGTTRAVCCPAAETTGNSGVVAQEAASKNNDSKPRRNQQLGVALVRSKRVAPAQVAAPTA